MRQSAFVAAIWVTSVSTSFAQEHGNLDRKDVFTKGFPQFLAFRGEMIRASHRDYAAWCESVGGASGVIRKFVKEELPGIYTDSVRWANRYAVEHPAALMLLHLNGEARQVIDFPNVHQRFFPGHWVYLPGTTLAADIEASDNQLRVHDIKRFSMKGYLHRRRDGTKAWFPQHLILVPLDERGRRRWDQSEYAILESLGQDGDTITVRRGTHFSTPRAHQAGKTYIAPLAGGVWGGKPMWFYNLSSVCPRDHKGQNAGDVFADEIATWFEEGGPLWNLNGIAFDVNYFEARDSDWDVDNDGVADGGFVTGRNVWLEGDWRFLQDLRRKLGDDLLITADGQHTRNQRAVGVLDGIESEGLVQHNDGFRGFSRTVNTHLYWQQYNPREHDFRYVVLKLMNPNDAQRGDQLRRLATGTACSLGALVTGTDGTFMPPEFAEPGALGFPRGPLIRYARSAPDLLRGMGTPPTDELTHRLITEGCGIQRHEQGLLITAASTGDTDLMVVTLTDVQVPAGDLTIFVEMTALDPLEGFHRDDHVPRAVHGHFSKVPDYGEGRYDAYYTDLYGYIGTHGASTLSFYLRRPNTSATWMDISFQIQGRGRVALHGITAHSAPDVLVRAFDHGVVVANPAFDSVTVALTDLLPQRRELDTVQVPGLDALFLKKP